MEGLYLRGKTYWFRFRPAPKAAQVRINLRTGDEIAAIAAARKIKSRPHSFTAVAGLSDWIDKYLAHKARKGCSRKWIVTLRYCLEEAAEYFDASPQRITVDHISKWQAAISSEDRVRETGSKKKAVNQRTVSIYSQWLRWFFDWLTEQGVIPHSPFDSIEPPKISPAIRKSFMTRDQADRVLNTVTVEDKDRAAQLRFCIFAALHAGLRRGEVVACRPRWFDLKAGLLHIQNEEDFTIKDRENRTIPLTREFLVFLKDYGLREPYMIAPEVAAGRFPYRFDFGPWFKSHIKALGLQQFTFHDLRRTFASLHASHGTPLYHIAKWLGDDPAVVEKTYAHLIPAHDRINGPWG